MRKLVRLAQRNRARLDGMIRTDLDRFPAKLTGKTFDTMHGVWAYSWTKRTYNANGLRVDDDSVSGTADWMPAYSFGDGWPVGEQDLQNGVDVWLRRRLVTSDRGPVYEFPWYCACTAGGSNAGGGIQTTCCDNTIPTDLYAVITSATCACVDGLTFTLTWNGSEWTGTLGRLSCEDANLATRTWSLTCTGGNWLLTTTELRIGSGVACSFGGHTRDSVNSMCSPFLEKWSGTMQNVIGFDPCSCDGLDWTIYITE